MKKTSKCSHCISWNHKIFRNVCWRNYLNESIVTIVVDSFSVVWLDSSTNHSTLVDDLYTVWYPWASASITIERRPIIQLHTKCATECACIGQFKWNKDKISNWCGFTNPLFVLWTLILVAHTTAPPCLLVENEGFYFRGLSDAWTRAEAN